MVGRGLSWWSVLAFAKHRRPHDALTQVLDPESYGWGLLELLVAKLAGASPKRGGSSNESGSVARREERYGVAVERAEVINDPWFWPAAREGEGRG